MRLVILVVLAVVAVVAAVDQFGSRKLDYKLSISTNNSGVLFRRFKGLITPEIPESPKVASDFADILEPAGLLEYSSSEPINSSGSRAYSWKGNGSETVTVTTKTCSDNVVCVDMVRVSPSETDILKNRASNSDNLRYISKADYQNWPFKVDEGVLRCDLPGAVTLLANGKAYALNGLARKPHRESVVEIQIPDPRPVMKGMYLGYGDVLDDGLALCAKQ